MKVLVIGAPGQLGTDVCKAYDGAEVYKADLAGADIALDICDGEAVHALIADDLRPDAVINTAAAHNVPKCEEEPGQAFAVNAKGTWNIAKACQAASAKFMHISTDYVFGMGGTRPYTEADLPMPLSIYGASKLAGEHLAAAYCQQHYIVRTSAIYGTAPCRAKGGRNFVSLMLHLAQTRGEVKVVTDEFVTPTYTGALARQLRRVLDEGQPGLYHATCQGQCSWFEFARAIFEETGTEVVLNEATSADFPSPVQRPDYSVLDNAHLREQGIDIMPDWRDGLVEYLQAAENSQAG